METITQKLNTLEVNEFRDIISSFKRLEMREEDPVERCEFLDEEILKTYQELQICQNLKDKKRLIVKLEQLNKSLDSEIYKIVTNFN